MDPVVGMIIVGALTFVGTITSSYFTTRRTADVELSNRRDELKKAITEDLETRLDQVNTNLEECKEREKKSQAWFEEQLAVERTAREALEREVARIDQEGTNAE